MTRRYHAPRRAYTPRMWPMLVLGAAIIVPVTLLLRGPLWVPYVVGGGVGGGLPLIRLWIWKRRHPLVKFDQWVQAQRDAAPWN